MTDSTPTGATPAENQTRPGEQARELAARLQDDQRARWARRDRMMVETYLQQYPLLETDAEAVLDLIYHEMLLCQEAGETPRLEDYLRRFPQYEAPLRDQFELEEIMNPGRLFASRRTQAASTVPAGPAASVSLPAIAGYQMLRVLAHGGMGVVYQARQIRLGHLVAIKMIRDSSRARPQHLARFEREAQVIARLQHPHIVQIYEVGEHEGCPYFTMEFMAGGSLDKQIAATPSSPRAAAQLVEVLARTIHFAHQHGIIHRDLKPANILLRPLTAVAPMNGGATNPSAAGSSVAPSTVSDFLPKITDFGLAKQIEEDQQHTQTGVVIGTLDYMAPEQARAEKVLTTAVDVFSLGAILYELLTQRPPFHAATPQETLARLQECEPDRPRKLNAQVDRDLETICLKCLEKEPSRRYGSARSRSERRRV
jgi:serine/threonine-protein kinase